MFARQPQGKRLLFRLIYGLYITLLPLTGVTGYS
jgi:hypothetical protein